MGGLFRTPTRRRRRVVTTADPSSTQDPRPPMSEDFGEERPAQISEGKRRQLRILEAIEADPDLKYRPSLREIRAYVATQPPCNIAGELIKTTDGKTASLTLGEAFIQAWFRFATDPANPDGHRDRVAFAKTCLGSPPPDNAAPPQIQSAPGQGLGATPDDDIPPEEMDRRLATVMERARQISEVRKLAAIDTTAIDVKQELIKETDLGNKDGAG